MTENFKINLNQNLWGLVVAFAALGASEYFHLCVLFGFAAALSAVMILSVMFTTWAYTRNYISNKQDKKSGGD